MLEKINNLGADKRTSRKTFRENKERERTIKIVVNNHI